MAEHGLMSLSSPAVIGVSMELTLPFSTGISLGTVLPGSSPWLLRELGQGPTREDSTPKILEGLWQKMTGGCLFCMLAGFISYIVI